MGGGTNEATEVLTRDKVFFLNYELLILNCKLLNINSLQQSLFCGALCKTLCSSEVKQKNIEPLYHCTIV